jgi:hypothetical protein
MAADQSAHQTDESSEVRYCAFISYSRRDEKFAKWLHRKLEGFRLPSSVQHRQVPRKCPLRPIFRDTDELAASSDLGVAITDALRASRSLIVVCSPDAAASKWVNREIEEFVASSQHDQIFLILVRGDPLIGSPGSPTGAFPPALAKRVNEPLWVDARKGGEGKARALARTIAGLLGLSFDTIWQRQRRMRRISRVAWSGAGLAIGIPMLITVAELTKPVDINDCPLDAVTMVADWNGGTFRVDRVGTSAVYQCQDGVMSLRQMAKLSQSGQTPFCRGPFGTFVLEGVLHDRIRDKLGHQHFVYERADGSPCCIWHAPKGQQLDQFMIDDDFRWLGRQDMIKFRDLAAPMIEVSEYPVSVEYLRGRVLFPVRCDVPFLEKIASIPETWFSEM